jgi:hypothetical protein
VVSGECLAAGLASQTTCAKAMDACAKACASANASATRGQRRRTVAQATRRRGRQGEWVWFCSLVTGNQKLETKLHQLSFVKLYCIFIAKVDRIANKGVTNAHFIQPRDVLSQKF